MYNLLLYDTFIRFARKFLLIDLHLKFNGRYFKTLLLFLWVTLTFSKEVF